MRKGKSKYRKKRGNSRYFVLFIVTGLLFIAIIGVLQHFVRQMSFFNIEHISISGNKNLNVSFMEEMAYDFIGKNIFSVYPQNIAAKYENIVRIKEVKVSRVLPNRLRINITERVGFVYLNTQEGSLVPIDKKLVILDNKGFYLSEDLPIIHTNIPQELLIPGTFVDDEFITSVVVFHEKISNTKIDCRAISEYYLEDGNLYMIETNTAARICLGEDNFCDKLDKLEFIWGNVSLEPYHAIDLRYKNQVVLRK